MKRLGQADLAEPFCNQHPDGLLDGFYHFFFPCGVGSAYRALSNTFVKLMPIAL